ncbi:benzoate/H(+) symporter BenE family transporter [Zoogloea dura]|nr:benzoate/H(+) symporter BenE family transporter [Zoogloea dura]
MSKAGAAQGMPAQDVPVAAGLRRDWSVSATAAGFLAVLISYSGPAIIIIQAAQVAGVSGDMIASWIWGVSIGAAVSGILLSWFLKVPVVTAWSAPGTALLVTLFPALSLNEAVGAYITAAGIIFLIGITGYFDKVLKLIPKGVAAGMMAGILFQFGANAFKSAGSMPLLTFVMLAAYLLFRRFVPRYCMVLVLLAGISLAVGMGGADLSHVKLGFTVPVLIAPEWSWGSTLSLALPLVLVSITGQFLPGMAILRGAGYTTPARPIIAVTSVVSAFVALAGGITIVIAAITAALCTGKDAHENPARRYVAGLGNGVFYLIGGCLAGTIVSLFTVLPKEFVAVLAGLALIGAITSNLMGTMAEADHREAAVITFLATASGMSFLGLGSAFWGVVLGSVAHLVLHHKPRAT